MVLSRLSKSTTAFQVDTSAYKLPGERWERKKEAVTGFLAGFRSSQTRDATRSANFDAKRTRNTMKLAQALEAADVPASRKFLRKHAVPIVDQAMVEAAPALIRDEMMASVGYDASAQPPWNTRDPAQRATFRRRALGLAASAGLGDANRARLTRYLAHSDHAQRADINAKDATSGNTVTDDAFEAGDHAMMHFLRSQPGFDANAMSSPIARNDVLNFQVMEAARDGDDAALMRHLAPLRADSAGPSTADDILPSYEANRIVGDGMAQAVQMAVYSALSERTGDAAMLRRLLQAGVDPNTSIETPYSKKDSIARYVVRTMTEAITAHRKTLAKHGLGGNVGMRPSEDVRMSTMREMAQLLLDFGEGLHEDHATIQQLKTAVELPAAPPPQFHAGGHGFLGEPITTAGPGRARR